MNTFKNLNNSDTERAGTWMAKQETSNGRIGRFIGYRLSTSKETCRLRNCYHRTKTKSLAEFFSKLVKGNGNILPALEQSLILIFLFQFWFSAVNIMPQRALLNVSKTVTERWWRKTESLSGSVDYGLIMQERGFHLQKPFGKKKHKLLILKRLDLLF